MGIYIYKSELNLIYKVERPSEREERVAESGLICCRILGRPLQMQAIDEQFLLSLQGVNI
jgi:hypothetical protein